MVTAKWTIEQNPFDLQFLERDEQPSMFCDVDQHTPRIAHAAYRWNHRCVLDRILNPMNGWHATQFLPILEPRTMTREIPAILICLKSSTALLVVAAITCSRSGRIVAALKWT